MVHEAVKTDMKGTRGFIVDKDSAAPLLPDVVYFGIEKNHSEMCKFDSKNSPGLVRPFPISHCFKSFETLSSLKIVALFRHYFNLSSPWTFLCLPPYL